MTAEAKSSTEQADEGGTVRAATALVDAWGPALDRSYRLGRGDGYNAGYVAGAADERAGWSAALGANRQAWRAPTQAELQQRRSAVDHSPCRQKCGGCSRCMHAASFTERGRPFLGVEAEARLAAEMAPGGGA